MDFFVEVGRWFIDPANWTGTDGVPVRVFELLWYSLVAAAAAIAVGLPIGLLIGHTDRGGQAAILIANQGRAIPTIGVVTIAWTILGFGYFPVFVSLFLLGLPPIVTNTYVGIRSVDPEVRDAAAGMGMTGGRVLRDVEVPLATPLIMAGVRTTVVQIVATATIAAFVGLGGVGRYILDGLSQRDFPQVFAGAILAALLALLAEGVLAAVQRAIVPAGLRAQARGTRLDAAATPTPRPAGDAPALKP